MRFKSAARLVVSGTKLRQPAMVAAAASDGLLAPAELAASGEDFLLLRSGQLVQASRQRADGWAYGSVIFDEMDAEGGRPPISEGRVSTNAGWFQLACTGHPTPAQLEALQAKLGGKGADALATPKEWASVTDPLVAQMFKLAEGSAERAKVEAAFRATLTPNVRVVSIERVQNVSMWQSYAVKRQTVVSREEKAAAAGGAANESRFERAWLFHGCQGDVVPKIVQQGFNRSFCGRNATAFGKGVYFARNASYSSSTQYSTPDAKGVQHMFACRVVVGEYCKGKRDALTPDVRRGHQLYDSTVNDLKHPEIFVTYHDAQAYPEYLIRFTQ